MVDTVAVVYRPRAVGAFRSARVGSCCARFLTIYSTEISDIDYYCVIPQPREGRSRTVISIRRQLPRLKPERESDREASADPFQGGRRLINCKHRQPAVDFKLIPGTFSLLTRRHEVIHWCRNYTRRACATNIPRAPTRYRLSPTYNIIAFCCCIPQILL